MAQTGGAGVLAFGPALVSVPENAGSATLTVTRAQGSAGAIGVGYSTVNGTATAGSAYAATNGTLTWADGDTSPRTINIPVFANAVLTGTQYFNVLLAGATGGATIATQNGALGKAIVRITDNQADNFPGGSGLPPGFFGSDNSGAGSWSVSPDVGYASPASLQSPITRVFLTLSCEYDYATDTETCTQVPMSGITSVSYTGSFLAGNVNFAYRVSSNIGLVTFRVLVDGVVVYSDSGHTAWTTASVPVAKGFRQIRWELVNTSGVACSLPADADGVPCDDRFYIDSVQMPSKATSLQVSAVGPGTVNVSGENPCVGDAVYTIFCSYQFAPNFPITLAAVPQPGYLFTGWSSNGCSGTTDCAVAMSMDRQLTANFQPINPTLTVFKSGTGSGTVTSSIAGIQCPGDCTESYANGTTLSLTAVPDAGSTFVRWGATGGMFGNLPDCADTGTSCPLTMTDNKQIYALFYTDQYQLTVNLTGTGTGTVTSSPPGISCPGTCTASFPRLTPVTLTATPSANSHGAFFNHYNCRFQQPNCSFAFDTGEINQYAMNVEFRAGAAPGAPTLDAVIAAGNGLRLNFSAPANDGGAAISSYAAICSLNGTPRPAASAATSPITVTNLAAGLLYSCVVKATNAFGTSAPSNAMSGTPAPLLVLQTVYSRKTHGSAGTFDFYFDNFAAPLTGNVSVEPRSGQDGHRVIFEFNLGISSVGSVTTNVGTAGFTVTGNKVFVTLSGVPDNRRVAVSLLNVASPGNDITAAASLGFLMGDVSDNRAIGAGDILGIKTHQGPVAFGNFKFDIDRSGTIDAADTGIVKGRSATSLVPN